MEKCILTTYFTHDSSQDYPMPMSCEQSMIVPYPPALEAALEWNVRIGSKASLYRTGGGFSANLGTLLGRVTTESGADEEEESAHSAQQVYLLTGIGLSRIRELA